MKFISTIYGKLHPLHIFKRFFSMTSLENKSKRKIFGQNPFRLSMKAKTVLSIAIILIMLVSVFAFLAKGNQNAPDIPQSTDIPVASSNSTATPNPTNKIQPSQTSQPNVISQITNVLGGFSNSIVQAVTPRAPGVVEAAQIMNSSVWREVAKNAWQAFRPGVGVDTVTGLPYSGGTDYPNFTDWDLGVYIQAIIDANQTGLINNEGAWGSSARLEKVVKFLETRELNSTTHYPYWFYQAKDGKDYHANSDLATNPVDIVDTGRLFVALNNLRLFNISLASRINDIVLYGQNYNRSDYAALVPSIYSESLYSTNIYAYYFESGFASFWPDDLSYAPTTILNNIWSAGNVTTPEGVSLPNAGILGEPLLCSVFDLNNNNPQLMALSRQVYLAHEAYFNATGKYRAFSEGPSFINLWIYEWVVFPDNRTWVVLDQHNSNLNISPMIYTDIAIGFLAIYNSTYAHDMVVYLERTLPDASNGYGTGVDESGAALTGISLNANGLIIGAAKYAIQNNP